MGSHDSRIDLIKRIVFLFVVVEFDWIKILCSSKGSIIAFTFTHNNITAS